MEKVQLSLERFLPELRDLERKKVFTKDEISDIVAKRRGFEVALSSRAVKPADYLRYIEYETRLEKLRKTRAARVQATTKKTLSDHSISAHITHLHRLSTRRFPSSLPLWDAFLSHSLTQASPLLVSRTLSSAIAMHPTHIPYWLLASRWESEGDEKGMGGGNAEGARRLCMRALRFLKGTDGEKEIWKEWIRLEVAFAERVRGRWSVLGIGKGKNGEEEITRVGEKKMEVDGEEEETEEIQLPAAEEEDDEMTKEVEEKVLSGQEAIIEGAIVRVVIDNALTSFKHSLAAYEHLINILRPLPTVLRLPLLSHVYASLTTHFAPSSPSYSQALHILATRSLYDVAFVPKATKEELAIAEATVDEIKVEGEALVDAVGKAVDEYWKACKGKKGKGKSKEKAPVAVWESFCAWLEEMADEVEEEDLAEFLTSNLTAALSLAPSSSFLSLLHLRHLLRTSAPHDVILSHAEATTKLFGSSPTPAATREEVWVARVETVVALDSSPEPVFAQAIKSLPFSGRLWSVHADYVESTQASSSDTISAWYEASIERVLLADAVPPIGFVSKFDSSDDNISSPRDLLPSRYLSYLSLSTPSLLVSRIDSLITRSPTLTLFFLSTILSVVPPSTKANKAFRTKVHERAVGHPEAGAKEWVDFAEELLKGGETAKSGEVVRRAGRSLKGGEKNEFERRWNEVVELA